MKTPTHQGSQQTSRSISAVNDLTIPRQSVVVAAAAAAAISSPSRKFLPSPSCHGGSAMRALRIARKTGCEWRRDAASSCEVRDVLCKNSIVFACNTSCSVVHTRGVCFAAAKSNFLLTAPVDGNKLPIRFYKV